jgi:hypothetical protein
MIEQLVNNDPSFYSDIRGDLISHPWSSLHHVDSVKSMHDNLNTLAMVVRFNSRSMMSQIDFLKFIKGHVHRGSASPGHHLRHPG